MNSRLTTVVMLLGVVLCLVGASWAQDAEGMARVALEQTDNLIDLASPQVHAASNQIATTMLERATDIQARAWDAYNRGDRAGYLLAYKLTLQAREFVQAALTNSRSTESQDGTVQRRLDRAEERLELAQQAIGGEDLPRLESLYSAARNNLDRAWEFFRSEQYRPALKLADQVEKAAKIILDAANSAERFKEQYDRRSSNVADLVAQAVAGEATCSSPDGKAAAEMASRTYDRAQELNASGKAQQALKALQSARDLAAKSIQACAGNTAETARLQNRYESLVGVMERLDEQVKAMTGGLTAPTKILLQQAQDLLAKAKGEIEAGKNRDAEASLQAAHLALSKAQDYIGSTR